MKLNPIISQLTKELICIISETNGISLNDTLDLLASTRTVKESSLQQDLLSEFRRLLGQFQQDEISINTLLQHPISSAFFLFFKNFPLPYYEDHIHLTGSLSEDFIFPRLMKILSGKNKKQHEAQILKVYGKEALPITCPEDIKQLITLKEGEQFDRYLKILLIPKMILTDRKAHQEAAFHMAKELFEKHNVGHIRLKFTLSRITSIKDEQIPGLDKLKEEDVVLGLYQGFMDFKKIHPSFSFILSPSFRKEPGFYDKDKFISKEEHFIYQVDQIIRMLDKYPELKPFLSEVDTVGSEKELFRKKHFNEMKYGFRRLQYNGFKIRSHHGETWNTLNKGIQAVDNAMNIWHIDNLEHGLSIGVNPNYYFQKIFQRVVDKNQQGQPIEEGTQEFLELDEMNWTEPKVKAKILTGKKLTEKEIVQFVKIKFHTAREVEHYQHDVLNRMINKGVSLVSLPSSNMKLTSCFPDYKDHPFSWWEKKGVTLGIGTDNYVTLGTNYINEMLILLYSDSENLKITKLLMVATKETRRPYLSHFLWDMRKSLVERLS